MPALIVSSAARTCLGTGATTFAALLAGRSGAGPLRRSGPAEVGVHAAYHLGPVAAPSASALLAGCVAEALAAAGRPGGRVLAVVGSGLGALAELEDAVLEGGPPGGGGLGARAFGAEDLHFADAVRAVTPGVADVMTLTGACSAGGHALAVAEDLLVAGAADAVVVGAADVLTTSMLAMIGVVGSGEVHRVRPFDRDRRGVLLGEGAAALVLVPDEPGRPARGRVLSTGLSCDAAHPTAPDVDGITRAMGDALDRAGRAPADVDLVIAHGTGTALNDPAECLALDAVLDGASPLVTAVKGAIGHTSGAAALVNLDVALRCLEGGVVPPVVGLDTPLTEGERLRFVRGGGVRAPVRIVQSHAFGFGGVNAVTLLEAV